MIEDANHKRTPDSKRLCDLHDDVQVFLQDLDEDDIKTIKAALKFYRDYETVKRFLRFTGMVGFTIFATVVSVLQGWKWIVDYFKGVPK